MARRATADADLSRQARSRILAVAWTVSAILILARIFYLQMVRGDYYAALSYENMMRLKVKTAPRGVISDRGGKILARNRPSFSVTLTYQNMKNRETLIEHLLKISDNHGEPVFDQKRLEQDIAQARRRRFEPYKLADDVDLSVVSVVEEHIASLPGVTVEAEARREYPYGSLACHALGYLGEIPEEKFEAFRREKFYRYGDQIGISGIEKQYEEPYLRGRDGQEYVMVDAFGQELGKIAEMPAREAVQGREIQLSLDLLLQQSAEAAFPESLSGALVALDPRNGEVLALLSSPRFDPNLFSRSSQRRNAQWRSLMLDPRKPLLNRAILGLYPPGSTFKFVTAAAALNENIVDPGEHFHPCFGGYNFGGRTYGCWNKKGHGAVGFVEGIKASCDVYFYQVGIKIGIEYMVQYARMFGLGRKTGLDFPEEAAGELLDEETYNRKFRDRGWSWTAGQVLNAAIGQAQIVTPLQLACLAAGLGNGHLLFRPRLLRAVPGESGAQPLLPADTLTRIDLQPEIHRMLERGLEAVLEAGGTGGRARVEGVRVGGKTGTAQNPQGEDHALFFAVAPLGAPEIAVVVVVENAGHGGSVAAPIAGKVLNAYFTSHAAHREPRT